MIINSRNGFKRRVVIVNSDPEMCMRFSLLINSSPQFFVINSYACAENSLKNINSDKPDILILDLAPQGSNTIEVISRIKDYAPHCEILVVSSYEDREVVFSVLKAGATGYIVKSENYLELLDAIEEIARGGAPLSTGISRLVVDSFHVNPNTPLSRRETEVLKLVAEGKTYSQISEELFISKETSKTHIKNIYSKLQVGSKSEALERAAADRLI